MIQSLETFGQCVDIFIGGILWRSSVLHREVRGQGMLSYRAARCSVSCSRTLTHYYFSCDFCLCVCVHASVLCLPAVAAQHTSLQDLSRDSQHCLITSLSVPTCTHLLSRPHKINLV